MILPLMNAMTLKTTTSTSTSKKTAAAAKTGSAAGPGGRKTRASATRTGLLLVGMLAVAAATFRFARRRSR